MPVQAIKPLAMITTHKSNLIARCQQRGYTLAEVMPCVISQDGDEWTIDVDHPAYPKEPRGNAPEPPQPDLSRTDTPSFLEKVKNFAVSSAKHVVNGMPMCSDEEIIRRHDICRGCEFFKDNTCGKCGCPLSRAKGYVSKLSWADQECPVGKWGRVDGK
jgi:hypothetical protein